MYLKKYYLNVYKLEMICIQKELFSYQKQNLKNGYKFLSHLHQRNLNPLRIKLSENLSLISHRLLGGSFFGLKINIED